MIDTKHTFCILMLISAIALIVYNNHMSNTEYFSDASGNKIVLYYANWCGYSRTFLPEWEKFESFAREQLSEVAVEKILCEGSDAEKCSHLKGFPTVILYKNNDAITFSGNRTTSDLVQFVRSHT